MESEIRRVTRSRNDRVFAGVCGGLAAYLGLDAVLVRVIYVALTLLSWGMGVVLYLLAWIIVPLQAEGEPQLAVDRGQPAQRDTRRIAGIFLLVIGLLALLSTAFGWFHVFSNVRIAGPVILLAVGVALLLWRRDPDVPSNQNPPLATSPVEKPAIDSPSAYRGSVPRRLMRLEQGKKLAGVCTGLGDYLNIDVTIIRLLFIAAIFAGGAGIILYLIMWLIVPVKRSVPLSTVGA